MTATEPWRDTPAEPSLGALVEQVRAAADDGQALRIVGGNTKSFYGRPCEGTVLDTTAHAGILSYEPTELVITARAGTLLSDIDAALAERGQMLGFEPPHLGEYSTIGGVIAAGLSGPARPWLGSARDFVLGLDVINGRAETLSFGGQVMKNVAGFDVSRLMAAALGTLGVITQVSLRVLPCAPAGATLTWTESRDDAHARMLAIAREPWPFTGMTFDGGRLRVRLAGTGEAVREAIARLAPEHHDEHDGFWTTLRDCTASVFGPGPEPVWRLALPPAAPDPAAAAQPFWLDWGGAQRWARGRLDHAALSKHCEAHGGHATCFRGADAAGVDEVFASPSPAMQRLHERLKQAFDPAGIFNRGRLYGWM